MIFERHFTEEGKHPFDTVEWKLFNCKIVGKKGNIVFEQTNVEFPSSWEQNDVDITTEKYFAGALNTKYRESSLKQVITRIVEWYTEKGIKDGYFTSSVDAEVFKDELMYILLHRYCIFNSPVLFNVGVQKDPQVSACFITSIEDTMDSISEKMKIEMDIFRRGSGDGTNLSNVRSSKEHVSTGGYAMGPLPIIRISDKIAGAVKSGGKTRRAALMKELSIEHGDIEDFITQKAEVEKAAKALIAAGWSNDFDDPKGAYGLLGLQNFNESVPTFDAFMESLYKDEDWALISRNTYNISLKDSTHKRTQQGVFVQDKEGNWFLQRSEDGDNLQYFRVLKWTKAKDLWNLICESSWECADPGLQFYDTINKWNTCKNDGDITGSNPCVIGDTLVAVADGRNYVSIKELAEKGMDTPVYSWSPIEGVRVRMGRNPRKTREKTEVWKLILDDDSYLITTPDHTFLRRNGEEVKLKDLQKGDSLLPFNKYQYATKTNFYWSVVTNKKDWRDSQEHTLVAEFLLDRKLKKHPIEVVHHRDFNGLNNSLENLQVMSQSNHKKLHKDIGTKYYENLSVEQKKEHSQVCNWWKDLTDDEILRRRKNLRKVFSGEGNPMFNKKHSSSTKKRMRVKSRKRWEDFSQRQNIGSKVRNSHFQKKQRGERIGRIPIKREFILCSNSLCRKKIYGTPSFLKDRKYCSIECRSMSRVGRKLKPLSKLSKERISFSLKKKAQTDSTFYQNLLYANAVKNKKVSSREEFYNHKVKEISFYGMEDVYNITVDDDHTVCYITSFDKLTKYTRLPKLTGVITKNCSEYFFLENTSCNLASHNLLRYEREDNVFDYESYMYVTRLFITAMDISVHNASYPTKKITNRTKQYRTLGLGYSNVGALLLSKGIPYDSEEGRCFIGSLTALLLATSYSTSAQLAKELGAFERYESNKHSVSTVLNMHKDEIIKLITDVRHFLTSLESNILRQSRDILEVSRDIIPTDVPIRNAQTVVIAPTGTISFWLGAETTGIEPMLGLKVYKKMVGGGFLELTSSCVEKGLIKLGYNENDIEIIQKQIQEKGYVVSNPLKNEHIKIFETSFGNQNLLKPEAHVKMMVVCQPFISGAISKTVNLPENATVEDISKIYQLSWDLGLKSVSVYRDNCKGSQPLTSSIEEGKPHTNGRPTPVRKRLPKKYPSHGHEFQIGNQKGFLNLGFYPDTKELGATFITISKAGSTLNGFMNAIAILISHMLQYKIPVEEVINTLRNLQFDPSGFTDNPDIKTATSIPDYVAKYIEKYLQENTIMEENVEIKRSNPSVNQIEGAYGPPCNICGQLTVKSGTCFRCINCGETTGCG